MKRFVATLSALMVTAALTVTAFAAGSVSGKVIKVEGDKVTVTIEGGAPPWAQKGANVSAAGGAPKVVSVDAKEVTLRFSRAKAAKIKVDSSMTITESDGDEMQGC